MPYTTKYDRSELARLLAAGLLADTLVRCATPADAKRLRWTLYRMRGAAGAKECKLSVVGSLVRIMPTRNPVLEEHL